MKRFSQSGGSNELQRVKAVEAVAAAADFSRARLEHAAGDALQVGVVAHQVGKAAVADGSHLDIKESSID